MMELRDPYLYLQQSLTKKVVVISTPSFADLMLVIDLWIVLLSDLNFQCFPVPIVSKISVIRVVPFSSYSLMRGLATIRLLLGNSIRRNLPFSLAVEQKMYTVLHLGPTNAPTFYTAMMQSLRKEWLLLFADTKHVIRINSSPVSIVCNENIIIDDILLYSNHVNTFLH